MSSKDRSNAFYPAKILTRYRTISRDLVASLVLAVTAVSIFTIYLNFWMVSIKSRQQNEQKAVEYMEYLKNSLELPLWNVDVEGVKKIGNSFFKNELVAMLKIKGFEGNVWFENKKAESELLENSGTINHKGQVIGQIELGLTHRIYKENNYNLLVSSLITLLFVLVVLAGATRFLCKVFLINPLNYLNDRIDRIAKGDYEFKTRKYHQREIETIISKFNDMAEKVENREKTLADLNILLKKEIEDRSQAQIALLESEEKYRFLVQNANDAIFIAQDEVIKFPNPRALELTGFSEEELGKTSFTHLIFSEDRSLVLERYRRRLSGESPPSTYSFRVVNKKGKKFWVELNSAVIMWEGRPATINFIRDITEQKRMEAQLRKAEKMESIGLMAGGIAHDLNNILSGIVSYPDLLLMDLLENSPLKQPLETIKDSGLRAAAVVSDLLTVARGVATSKEVSNLNIIVEEYFRSAEHKRQKALNPSVTFTRRLDSNLLNISCYSPHIKKSLMNLVINASEAIVGSGSVVVTTMNLYLDQPLRGYEDVRRGEYALQRVSDDGTGISPEALERIFEPFYTKKVMGRSGTGLGLSVVWNTVQDHEGYIDVTSNEKGTTFELYFPVVREELAIDAQQAVFKDLIGNGEKILVVDDEENQKEIACLLLTKLGYSAHAVSSGEEAVEYLKQHSVDLIVLDMIMYPGMNGRETYERVRKINPSQKAIIASGFSETEDVKAAQKLGAGKYLKKPYTLEKIGMAVRDELKKSCE